MAKLRKWQSNCKSLALRKYAEGQKHFLCLATPGAGKSIMAAAVSKTLLDLGQVDLIVCFSPSRAIALGLSSTFESYLNCRFDGKMGAVGHSFTYQSMSNLDSSFWQLFHDYRVLVVLDEIHHCAGDTFERANAWGQMILKNVQSLATYTLALTGTPWRTDAIPICLANYSHKGKVVCDYTYGLQEAIDSNVCRRPTLTLFDNDQLIGGTGSSTYKGIQHYLESPESIYSDLLQSNDVINHVIKAASNKLSELQRAHPDAAGLIVAESIKHAQMICDLIAKTLNEDAILVTHHDPCAQDSIESFRHSDDNWIVSVGMISEGTDIPRLRVCCHLSNVKTELYFRQILGRVIRNTDKHTARAFLFTLAHPVLVEYAERLKEEVPETKLAFEQTERIAAPVNSKTNNSVTDLEASKINSLRALGSNWSEAKLNEQHNRSSYESSSNNEYFQIVGKYRAMLFKPFG
ncbi:DEAD/DEAH box helicase [Thaumasiovibrio sp. DFM-14]|uniref:DEAD/DEAH box helicase n=1 Tax=Thaumasiovibrio sp. DFM-14 TaxID=3384792 RepID=UPI0039A167EF